ncbi:MAG: BrnT family toxin [Methylococcaceae bacterium]|nr:BrnT family toxin [Methylococcaceae bacterium]
MKFDWHLEKAQSNLKKHGISFEEGSSVFDDFLAYIFDDKYSSINENRELIIGYSNLNNLLVVSFTEREDGLIRIISCREATTRERKNHEQHRS